MIARRSRLILLVLLATGAGAGAVALVWWHRSRTEVVEPPVIDLGGEDDPNLAQVIEDARSKVLREPRSAAQWGRLGKILLANGFGEDSVPCFREAARLDPSEPRWPYLRGVAEQAINPDTALPSFREAARRVRGESPAAAIVQRRYAEALMRKGETAEAETLLRAVLQRQPDDAPVLLDLGILADNANDLDTAQSYLLRCADSPLTRRRALTRLATLCLRKGDSAAAERYRKQVQQAPPDRDAPDSYSDEYKTFLVGRRARLLRAEYLLRAGSIPEAVEILEPLTREDDAEPEAFVKLGMAWALLGKYRQAEEVLRQGLAQGGEKVQAHFFLALSLFHQAEQSGDVARFKEAAAQARLALKQKPDHAFAHLYLGLALNKLGQPQEALAELEQAVRLSPESTDPQLHLGQALLAVGRKQEGYAHLQKAVELAGDRDSRPLTALKEWQERMEKK